MSKPKTRTDTSDLIEEPGQGHNSFAKEELEKTILAVENLIAERDNINADIRQAMEVAAQKGLDKRAIREALKVRALDPDVRQERESLRDLYLTTLGLI